MTSRAPFAMAAPAGTPPKRTPETKDDTMTDTAAPIANFAHTDAAADWANSAERVPLFTVSRPSDDGGEPIVETFTMPAKPNAGLALRFLRMVRTAVSPDVAMSWLIEAAVGEAGYLALADELSGIEDGEEAQRILQALTEKIQRVAMGGLEGKA